MLGIDKDTAMTILVVASMVFAAMCIPIIYLSPDKAVVEMGHDSISIESISGSGRDHFLVIKCNSPRYAGSTKIVVMRDGETQEVNGRVFHVEETVKRLIDIEWEITIKTENNETVTIYMD